MAGPGHLLLPRSDETILLSALATRLRERKLVQWTLAYLAGAWALLQLIGFLADTFGWPVLVPQVATVLLGVGFLSFIVTYVLWLLYRLTGPRR